MLLPFYDLLEILGFAFLILLLIGLSRPQLLLYRKRSTIGWLFGLPLFLCAIIAGNAEENINKSSSISLKSLNMGTDIENSTVNKILNNMIFIDSNLYVCKYELSSYEWECIMGERLKFSEIGNYPARNITESDCHRFLVKIREISGIGFNIPTVEEWMRIVRDNYTTYYTYAGSNNIDEVAWYNGNSDNRVHPVGMKKPTKNGIFDLCGNVWEYCYGEDFGYCTAKGGGACSDSMYCMLTDSSGDSIYIEPFEIGLRLVINKSPIFNLHE